MRIREEIQDKHDTLTALFTAVTFFAKLNQKNEAANCVEALRSISAATGNYEALAYLAFGLGEIALLNNNVREATQQFDSAIGILKRITVPVEIIRMRLRYAAALLQGNDRDPAVAQLRHAYRSARKLGARPLAGEASAFLTRLHEPVEDRRNENAPARAMNAGLTARQMEIIQAMARGLTNKEIAGQLYLSPRTVDMHVGHILERMACRTRTEAVKKAAELGLFHGDKTS
jgi:DNA-binding NarL/FixJ family response regulator